MNALADYITESANPGNKKRVASLEISYPSPFLESGIIPIDTPGIKSTHAHNTRTTESYLQQADAAIVVLSVDPPIIEVESQFVKSLKEDIPKLFFFLIRLIWSWQTKFLSSDCTLSSGTVLSCRFDS